VKVTDEMVERALSEWYNLSDTARESGKRTLNTRDTIRSILEAALKDVQVCPPGTYPENRLRTNYLEHTAESLEWDVKQLEAKLAKVRALAEEWLEQAATNENAPWYVPGTGGQGKYDTTPLEMAAFVQREHAKEIRAILDEEP
jgi:hypothetical protein